MGLAGCQQEGCERGDIVCNELANKPEYSLMQSVFHTLDERTISQPVVILHDFRGSGKTVLAFPQRDAEGMVVLLANADISPRDKTVPDADFEVSDEALELLESGEVELSPEARSLIDQMAATTS